MLQAYSEYSLPGLASRELSPQAYSSFVLSVSVIGIALNPVLLFLLMYVIGRGLDLKGDYPAIASSLFVGGLVGGFAGRALVYFASPASVDGLSAMGSITLESVGSAVSGVFVGFTAAALAFVRRRSGPREGAQAGGQA
jgi:hypothetical protein